MKGEELRVSKDKIEYIEYIDSKEKEYRENRERHVIKLNGNELG